MLRWALRAETEVVREVMRAREAVYFGLGGWRSRCLVENRWGLRGWNHQSMESW